MTINVEQVTDLKFMFKKVDRTLFEIVGLGHHVSQDMKKRKAGTMILIFASVGGYTLHIHRLSL